MKQIKITTENKQIINNWCNGVQSKAKVRTIDFWDIVKICTAVEKKISIPKKYMHGITILADAHGEKFPSAYKYTPQSTLFTATYKRGSWYLVSVMRDDSIQSFENVKITLTSEAREKIIEKYKSTHC